MIMGLHNNHVISNANLYINSLNRARYLLHFVIKPNQHKTQGKEISISYKFRIILEIIVHSGAPHMACINDYMSCTNLIKNISLHLLPIFYRCFIIVC